MAHAAWQSVRATGAICLARPEKTPMALVRLVSGQAGACLRVR